ncbi:WD40 repeat-like protein, partial [Rhizopogon vinicolor AM-OR11-026]
MRGHTELVRGVALLPDGRRIITSSFDGSLRLWNLESGKHIGDDWRDVDGVQVFTIALSPNGKTVASGNGDGTVRLWDVETKKVISRWTGHSQSVESVCWSADGEHVVSGGQDGTVRVWDVESSKTILGPIKTGHDRVYAVIYSPDTTKIATAGYNENAIKIWDANTGKLLFTIRCEESTMRGHTDRVRGVAPLPDGRRIITCSLDGSLRLWDLESGTQIGGGWRDGDKGAVMTIALSPNGKTVASGSVTGIVTWWDVETKKVISRWTGHSESVESVCWSADGEHVVSGARDGTVRVWDVKSSKTILGPIKTGHDGVYAVIYSPDTTKIATAGYNENAIKFWDANTGKPLFTIEHEEQVWSLAWTSDDKKLISGSADGSIVIFDTATWQQTAMLEDEDVRDVFTIALSPNGKTVASGNDDGTVRLWDVETKKVISRWTGRSNSVRSVCWSADGEHVVSGGQDGTVRVWDVESSKTI